MTTIIGVAIQLALVSLFLLACLVWTDAKR
jgi:hypothetical protein